MILNAHNYLFFRIYDWQHDWWDSGSDPKFLAALSVSFLLYLNLLSIIRIVPYLTGYEFPGELVFLMFVAVILGIANVYYFLRGDKASQISKRFKSENEKDRRLNLAWCWYYVVMTKVVFITAVQTLPLK